MQATPNETEDEAQEYYVVPEEVIQHFPEEWRNHFQGMLDDHHAVLKSADPELSKLLRLSKSLGSLAALKHAQKRLAEYEFAANLDSWMDLEILTTAFVVAYVRLHLGENGGSGFSPGHLPEKLRESHFEIVDLRNMRFAHNDDHPSVANAMHIDVCNDRFEIKFRLSLGGYIGGKAEWHELVKFLDSMIAEKMFNLIAKLKEKTGRDWALATGPAPE